MIKARPSTSWSPPTHDCVCVCTSDNKNGDGESEDLNWGKVLTEDVNLHVLGVFGEAGEEKTHVKSKLWTNVEKGKQRLRGESNYLKLMKRWE